MRPNISVVFPLYKDEFTVQTMVDKSLKILEMTADQFEIIAVDDGSPDRAGELADSISKQNSNIRVIHHPKNLGYGAAIRTGLNAAKHEWICVVDGDDEYDVMDLPKLLNHIEQSDLIITYRFVKKYSTSRIFISAVYNKILRLLFKTKFKDISSGLRLIRRDILSDINLNSQSPFLGAELAIKAKYKNYNISEVGIETFPRKFGRGSATSFKNIYATIVEMLNMHNHILKNSHEYRIIRKA